MLTWAGLDACAVGVTHGFKPPLRTRTLWLQRNARCVLRVFASAVEATGPLPKAGLLVCNHLSYLDILLLAALTPAVFVSKHEVRHWPVLGWFSRMAGTVFIRRERRGDVARSGEEIHGLMRGGLLVVLFPEGTSSDGRQVLPFKSSLLEPATGMDHELFAGHIAYAIAEGSVENDVCYWGDMTFFPHAMRMLTRPRVTASVRFSRFQAGNADRKDLARQLHVEVMRLKTSMGAE
jgi:1-acyl-sn-glycerol-3-phosphate acyltransferase